MRRTLLLSLLLLLATAPGAAAEIRIVDSVTGASHTLLRDGRLIGFPDAAAVIVRRRGRVLRVDIADRHVTRLRHLERELESVGPGGRSAELTRDARERSGIVLRDGVGCMIGSYDFGSSWWDPRSRGRTTPPASRSSWRHSCG